MEPKELEKAGWVIVGDVANGIWAAFRPENWEKERAFAPVSEVRGLPPNGEEAARLTGAGKE